MTLTTHHVDQCLNDAPQGPSLPALSEVEGRSGRRKRWRSAESDRATRTVVTIVLCFGIILATSFAVAQKQDSRRSSYHDMGKSLQAMQDDDTANPGMLWVQEGAALWAKPAGTAGKACADCHAGADSMSGVAARFPAFDSARDRPVTLEQRINLCRTDNQKAAPLAPESRELLALIAVVAYQSRGRAIAPPDDARLRPFAEAGEALFKRRQGQLNLSCAQCHDANDGRRLGGATIPQGHPTGYPIYRLEWQDLGSLRRRLRNCLVGMRAEPYALDAPEYVALELFLMRRAGGMTLESPGVRP